ncbi:molybdate transport system ATP-binding protein [Lentibacillus persicus]|uniref:Molybdate transport system ATP-binding protein n=1 Tax=Lentibacillus persicus TaxID=640948 RepID=A0A1I1UJ42_9BACI|nr:ATP-binding cassette domain-containing protein [Lentibacillus persicus]SFD70789.1 molybdate transport system ATP-binding protein [Lentibacillus persicus]
MLSINIQKNLQAFMLDVHFNVKSEIAVLFGPSGSGKTTVLNCIAGLTHPNVGQITLNQRDFFPKKGKPVPAAKRHIGYVFQDYALFPHMTVKKNIQYGLKDHHLMDRLTDMMGIDHLLDKYPHQISGGEKQRAALARALVTKPDALLLDEPFSSLDHETKTECQNELLELHKLWQIPVLLVTHDKEEASILGDRLLRIDKGKLVT